MMILLMIWAMQAESVKMGSKAEADVANPRKAEDGLHQEEEDRFAPEEPAL